MSGSAKPRKRKKAAAVPVKCNSTHLESDGFCTLCGRNHFGGESAPVADEKVVRSLVALGRYRDLAGVSHRELRIDTKLWKMNMIVGLIDSSVD